MALRAVLAELPPGASLLLTTADDDRVARIRSRPAPAVEVQARGERLAAFACRTDTDVLARVERNLHEHWGVQHPSALLYDYEGPVPPRLRGALGGDDLVSDLPPGEGPSDVAHSQGDPAAADVASRLSPEVLERLRGLGRTDLD